MSTPNTLATLTVSLADRSYPIAIGTGLFGSEGQYAQLPKSHKALIVTNTVVGPLYGAQLRAALAPLYSEVLYLELPDGESFKTWESLNLIFDALLAASCDRKTMLYALGGGVVGDMVGFAAACYMRGVPFVQIPTTLLAQVDSSVGGKTAVNHPLGKNMIGAFYQPLRVVVDLDVLATLPAREFSAGVAEIIKYGPIYDASFLNWLDENHFANLDALMARDPKALAYAIEKSCAIKADVVAQDEREGGLRAILNFGHTFGHAIEAGLGYGQWLHGEAVGCGMVMAAELSKQLGLVNEAFVTRLATLCQRAKLPVTLPASLGLSPERMVELMQVDKKAEAGKLIFVLIQTQSDGVSQHLSAEKAILKSVDEPTVLQAIRANQQRFA